MKQEIEKANLSQTSEINKVAPQKVYVLIPFLFLTVTLLGGMRISDKGFLFLKPDLVFFVLAAFLIALFFKTNLISLEDWLFGHSSLLKTVSNLAILATLFSASIQIFNSLTPENGLAFWIISFCFFWVLWNNLFLELSPKKMIRSLVALFSFAFVTKYIFLANLTAPTTETWWQALLENPAKQTLTWLLDLPRFSPATGYLQFFNLAIYLIALYLFPTSTRETLTANS
ncbi:MAG: hypothetical protein N2Z23_00395 [Pyrinomonadaceae bacterium]|nr:hypothetical protein [Pyrinomonadaceae bacterium]MCX7638892.1 hypothetical protein [Pyrinomonadaceae bacterium]MDW8304971.1 hypothetical protein [Acidobacteriota bacterium]